MSVLSDVVLVVLAAVYVVGDVVYLRLVGSVEGNITNGACRDGGVLVALCIIPALDGVAILSGNCGKRDLYIGRDNIL